MRVPIIHKGLYSYNSSNALCLKPLFEASFYQNSKKSDSSRVAASDTAKENLSAFYRISFERAVGQTDAVQPCKRTCLSSVLCFGIHVKCFSSVQSLSRVRLFATPWIAARQASVSITISRSSLSLTSIESVMPSSHLILGRPLLLLPPIPPSIRVFSNESTLQDLLKTSLPPHPTLKNGK